MKLAMAQMSMTGSVDENLKKSLAFCDAAAGSDLLFFPEVQLTPFFPQYAERNADLRRHVQPRGARGRDELFRRVAHRAPERRRDL